MARKVSPISAAISEAATKAYSQGVTGGHPEVDHRSVALEIEKEINDRSGIGWSGVDEDTREDILASLVEVLERHYGGVE